MASQTVQVKAAGHKVSRVADFVDVTGRVISNFIFDVISVTGQEYVVTANDDNTFDCTCQFGQHNANQVMGGVVCSHVYAVAMQVS